MDAEDGAGGVEGDAVGGAGHLSKAVVLAEAEDEEVGAAGGDFGEDGFDFAAVDEGGFGGYTGVGCVLEG